MPDPSRSAADPTSRSRLLAPRALRLARAILVLALLAPLTAALVGCEWKGFLATNELVDPEQGNKLRPDGRARPRVQTILSTLDLGVTAPAADFASARDVQARDLEVVYEQYRIGPGDIVRVSISELAGPGQPAYVEPLNVSDTGLITLPDLPERQVRVSGMTEVEAAAAIEEAYVRAEVFVQPPKVSVLVLDMKSRAFNITGNVGSPGRWILTKPDFRMIDALTVGNAGVDPQTSGEYAYVIRATPPAGAGTGATPEGGQPGTRPGQGDPLNPRSDAGDPTDRRDWPFEEEKQAKPAEPAPVFAHVAQNQPAGGGGGARGTGFQFQAPQEPAGTEVIRIPMRDLLRGQLRYNIVIRPEDTIIIPPPQTGEYYVGGHVVQPGVFAILPGRRLTVKQAIISARMLDEVAIPGRTQFTRRVGDQDVFLRIDVAKIFVGEEPDIFLQADDIIMVGTNFPAPFIAALRNGFRVTYGFGFLYDRNFAYDRNDRFQ